jgi:hypothetical protein
MSGVGFEPTIQTFERAKTVHALDRAATAVSMKISTNLKDSLSKISHFPFSPGRHKQSYIFLNICQCAKDDKQLP